MNEISVLTLVISLNCVAFVLALNRLIDRIDDLRQTISDSNNDISEVIRLIANKI